MLCRSCSESNPMGRATCIMCGAPLHERATPSLKSTKKSSVGGFVGAAVAIFIFQIISPYIFELGDPVNYIRVIAAAAFGGLGALLGQRVSKVIKEKSN